jgi:hypothetical protein
MADFGLWNRKNSYIKTLFNLAVLVVAKTAIQPVLSGD